MPIWVGALDQGTIAGAPAYASKSMSAATMICGDWSQLVVAEYCPGIELRINAFANFQGGIVGMNVMYTADIATAFPTAFSVDTSIS